jgi:hypothetical protein
MLEQVVCQFAKDLDADMLTATGRDGWWGIHTPGWHKAGTLYSKDLKP